jgi:hypothetical protein
MRLILAAALLLALGCGGDAPGPPAGICTAEKAEEILGTAPGDRRWLPGCDYDQDGLITLRDVSLALRVTSP